MLQEVFSLMVQEERQRSMSTNGAFQIQQNMTMLAKNENLQNLTMLANSEAAKRVYAQQSYNKKRDRPFCTHCQSHGHTIANCFKIHGYPPGYKPKKTYNLNSRGNTLNQASVLDTSDQLPASTDQVAYSPVDGLLQSLSSTQCQQLMQLFSSHLNGDSVNQQSTSNNNIT